VTHRKPFIAPALTSSVALSELTLYSVSGGSWGGGSGGVSLWDLFRRWFGGSW
jgi:hypothetical protein